MKSFIPALLAASVGASPLYRAGKSAVESRTIAVTSTDISTFALYAQWAGSAYCNSEKTVGSTVTCSESVCTTVNANNATIVANLGSDKTETDMIGFAGYDPVKDQIVVTYRGSSSIRNWLANIQIDQVPCSKYLSAGLSASIGSSCKLHEGFAKAWTSLSNDTYNGVAKALAAHPSAAIVVTGHSLGGAVATIAAAELRSKGYTVDLFTYGSPRVGNTGFVSYLSSQGPVGSVGSSGTSHYRITHMDDPVPQLPPSDVLNYFHTSPEFWLSNAGVAATSTEPGYFEGKIDYAVSDVKICTGYESYSCNAGDPSLNVAAHLSYFEPISGCNSDVLAFKKRDLEIIARLQDQPDMA
ncbi:lipase [Ophiostoma piceae UAMH 11346]|uniref:Lipase n=1 Tax=Ophiostoma piceae (strain UAMH 11346) TaxID=1262450 RepID=S3D9X2_OPHP1|nr:lipase [Ophiostoma piceae UAMH 11346]